MKLAHRRRSLRLPGYDYSHQGAYFVTIFGKERMPLFGKIVNKEMINNENDNLVSDTWNKLPAHYPHIALDAFLVMPI
jgi:putative transposase